jgi:hypothetical protein
MKRLIIAVVLCAVAAVNGGTNAVARPLDAGGTSAIASTRAVGAAAVIDPALAARLASADPSTPIEAIVVLKQQAAVPSDAGATASARVTRVVRALHRTADTAQQSLLTLLAKREAQGAVT